MNVGSLFSGIGGMDHGLAQAGHHHVFFCESDPWRRTVLAHHWPGVPIYEDVRAVGKPAGRTGADGCGAPVDSGGWKAGTGLLCGGFPCQDLSVAGRRAGLAGARSGLFHEFARIAESLRPRWLLVENVPGLLSSNGGRDFGIVLGTLADIGYGLAWRILDSRFFGVPQRRRRVYIVGARADGDPRAAAQRAGQVLAVGTRCPGHPATRGEARPDLAGTLGGGAGSRGWAQDTERMTFVPVTSYALTTSQQRFGDTTQETFVVGPLQNAGGDPRGIPSTDEVAGGQLVSAASYLLGQHTRDRRAITGCQPADTKIADAVIVGTDFNGGEDRVRDLIGVPVVPIGDGDVQMNENGAGHGSSNRDGDTTSIAKSGANRNGWDGDTSSPARMAPVISFDAEMSNQGKPSEHAYLTRKLRRAIASEATGVRRLTPTECERLQALPDGWTDHGPDSRRYAGLGDAVTSSVAEWIGRRLMDAT